LEIKKAIVLYIFLLLYNNLINLLPADFHAKIYVGFNFLLLIFLLYYSAKFLNLNFLEIGYESKYFFNSLIFGFLFSLIVLLPFLFLLILLPKLGVVIKPPLIMIDSQSEFFYKLFIRIPLGTALFEENLFRGILYAYLIKKNSIKKTFIITSIFFTIWHIMPVLKVVSSNFQMRLSLVGMVMWLAGIIGAFIAGLFFAILRYKGKSIVGCIISHALINDLTLIIIIYLWR